METEVSPLDHELDPNSQEYQDLMVAKFDEANGIKPEVEDEEPEDLTETPERPAWLPEKFKSAEDLAAAYAALEQKQSKPAEQAPASETDKAAQAAVEGAGLDMTILTSEYAEQGSLSDKSFEALAKAGIPREFVDAYIEGQEALASAHRSTVLSVVGGEEAYAELSAWASSALDADALEAYNQAVEGRNLGAAKLAVMGLKAQFEAVNGIVPTLIDGEVSQNGNNTFQSTAELTAAMKDPRYKTDPAYRASVEARLKGASNVF